jgi:hypothetical protein
LRQKATHKLYIKTVPAIVCDDWSEAQVKAFHILVNKSAPWADWDEKILAQV